MLELQNASRERKQPLLVEALKRSPQALHGDPVLVESIDRLERCGRVHSGKYTQLGTRSPGKFRCGLVFCPSCQGRKRGKAQARSVALVVAATSAEPDHREVFLATIDAAKEMSMKAFRKDLSRAERVLGFRITGWIQVGLSGCLHFHGTVIAAQDGANCGGS